MPILSSQSHAYWLRGERSSCMLFACSGTGRGDIKCSEVSKVKIDCHVHVNWQGYDATKVIAHMDKLGIDQAWVLTWEMVNGLQVGYQHLSMQEMWAACRKYPRRLLPFHAPDPRRPDAERLLREEIRRGLRGFGECKVRTCIDDPDLVRLFRIAGDAGLPVLLHLGKAEPPEYAHWYLHGIDGLARVLDMLPHVNFVGHGPGFWRYISGDEARDPSGYPKGKVTPGGKLLHLLRRYKNLYCDLSAMSGLNAISRDPEWGRRFLIRYRTRILYGTDMFDRRHLDYLESLRLDATTMRLIMGENAQRLVRR